MDTTQGFQLHRRDARLSSFGWCTCAPLAHVERRHRRLQTSLYTARTVRCSANVSYDTDYCTYSWTRPTHANFRDARTCAASASAAAPTAEGGRNALVYCRRVSAPTSHGDPSIHTASGRRNSVQYRSGAFVAGAFQEAPRCAMRIRSWRATLGDAFRQVWTMGFGNAIGLYRFNKRYRVYSQMFKEVYRFPRAIAKQLPRNPFIFNTSLNPIKCIHF